MCGLWLGMGLSLFLLRSLIAKQVWRLWLALFYDYRIVLNIQKLTQKLKTNIHCLGLRQWSVTCVTKWERRNSQLREERKLHCHNRLDVYGQVFLLRPSVLHTAPPSATANIPQTKINVSLWVKSLHKQEYQQSASSLCPWIGHNRLFVQLKL